MQFRPVCCAVTLLFVGGLGCGAEGDEIGTVTESFKVFMDADTLSGCTTQYHLEGRAPFGEPLRIAELRFDADEDVARVDVWLTTDFEPAGVCPSLMPGDTVVYQGAPISEPIEVDDGIVADDGMAVVVVTERSPCDGCELEQADLRMELDLVAP